MQRYINIIICYSLVDYMPETNLGYLKIIAPHIDPEIYAAVNNGIEYYKKNDAAFSISGLSETLDEKIQSCLKENDLVHAIKQLKNVGILINGGLENGRDYKKHNLYEAASWFNAELTYSSMVINYMGYTTDAEIKNDSLLQQITDEDERILLMHDLGCLKKGIIPKSYDTRAQLRKEPTFLKNSQNEHEIFYFLDGAVVAEINENGSFTVGIYDVKKQDEKILQYLNPNSKSKACITGNLKNQLEIGEPIKSKYPKYSVMDSVTLHFLLHCLGYDSDISEKFIPKQVHFKNLDMKVL